MDKQLKHVHVVFKTHFDIGFTHLVRELREWYSGDMLREAADLCEATAQNPEGKRYVWTLPAWPLRTALENVSDGALKGRVEALVRGGQLAWHALPFTTHTEFCGLEEFIRGFSHAKWLENRYGRGTISAKMTDVPGHTRVLPSLLAGAGVKFLHLGCNPCAAQPQVPPLFYWEGPDGARVLTFYARGGYGSGLLPPDGWPYPYWLAMMAKGENTGVHGADVVEDVLARAAVQLPGCGVSIGTMDDFARAMLAGDFDIPVVRGDLADTWIRGVGSAPLGVRRVRAARRKLDTLSAAAAFLASPKGAATARAGLDKAYEHTLLFGEHTWGLDTKTTILPERRHGNPWDGYPFWRENGYAKEVFQTLKTDDPAYRRMEASWREQLGFAEQAEQQARQVCALLGAGLSGGWLTIVSATGHKGPARVRLPESFTGEPLVNVETGDAYPVLLDSQGERWASPALPAAGFAGFRAGPRMEAPMEGFAVVESDVSVRVDTALLSVEVDRQSGCLTRLYHKPTRREWVAAGNALGFGQYLYDVYSGDELDRYLKEYLYNFADWGIDDNGKAGYPKQHPHLAAVPAGFHLAVEKSEGECTILARAAIGGITTQTYGNAQMLETRITVYADAPWVDFRFDLLGKGETPMLETGQFAFPLAAEGPRVRLNKLGSVVDPAADIPGGCNHDLFCVEQWFDVSDENGGVAFMPLDMPLAAFHRDAALRHTGRFSEDAATVFCHAFNNGWGTNFPQWIGGDPSYRIRVMPHGADAPAESLFLAAAQHYNRPLVLEGAPAKANFDLLPEGLDGFLVVALALAENHREWALRVRDIRGSARTARLHLSGAVAKIWRCNLHGEKETELPLKWANTGAEVWFETATYEIHTFIAEVREDT